MLSFIKNFLETRTFRVRANGFTSSRRVLQNGTPQGSTLSPTLFLIAINSIIHQIKLPVFTSLYADDLVIYLKTNNVTLGSHILQTALHTIENWSQNTGFIFSGEKTRYLIFSKRKDYPNIQLTLNGVMLKQSEEINFLGLSFERDLKWKNHVTNLQRSCQSRINLLKMLSNTSWGADTTTLLNLYRSLIRSKLDYGCLCYDTANKTSLKKT